MARLYADEDFPFPVVEGLRSLGHDVLTIQEDGKANRGVPDEVVLSVASTQMRAVLTMNHRDFVRLHMESSIHYGIVTCTYDLEFERQARRVHESIEQYETLERELIRVIRGAPQVRLYVSLGVSSGCLKDGEIGRCRHALGNSKRRQYQ